MSLSSFGAPLANRMRTGFAKVNNNQITGALFQRYTDPQTMKRDKPEAACALGCLALGFKTDPDKLAGQTSFWPKDTPNPRVDCPVKSHAYSGYKGAASSIVMHLNDDHRWSIEKIADWLATINADGTVTTA